MNIVDVDNIHPSSHSLNYPQKTLTHIHLNFILYFIFIFKILLIHCPVNNAHHGSADLQVIIPLQTVTSLSSVAIRCQ